VNLNRTSTRPADAVPGEVLTHFKTNVSSVARLMLCVVSENVPAAVLAAMTIDKALSLVVVVFLAVQVSDPSFGCVPPVRMTRFETVPGPGVVLIRFDSVVESHRDAAEADSCIV
jgi:hypothetical protein